MQRVILSVRFGGETRERDLELPAEVEVGSLMETIARALGRHAVGPSHPGGYRVEAHPPGRALAPAETLASAGVWDGARLVIRAVEPGRSAPRPADDEAAAPPAGPVRGWRKLDIEGPREAGAAPGRLRPASAFVWKRMDDPP